MDSQGRPGHGKYCVIHAIALNCFAGNRGRIYLNHNYFGQNYYGWNWNWLRRLKLQWIGRPDNYRLQIKTVSNYGSEGRIIIYVKSLLNDEIEPVD